MEDRLTAIENTSVFSIAIDGPAGAGKSTLAAMLAKKLGYIYIDTGALYRTVGVNAINYAGGYGDREKVIESLGSCEISLKIEDKVQKIYLNGECVGANIRTPEASLAASAVSAIPEVRQFLLDFQRNAAEKYNVIMDGRDIGTVILPQAQVKIFLTAKPEARAARRYAELSEKGAGVTYEQVLADIIKRDKNDSERAAAPLKPAEDSITADTTDLTLEQSFELLLEIINKKLAVVK